ncbi:hypothetical protein ACWCL1_07355 [Ligilactobacillus sp. LYQ135]
MRDQLMALLSLIPKYSNSFFKKGLMDVMMLFISKAVLVLAILGINLCQSVTDTTPPNSLSGYFLNAFIFYLILNFRMEES